MTEYPRVRQIAGERKRRWFFADDMDLVVWLDPDDSVAGFELCYDKAWRQLAFSWRRHSGHTHAAVDDGEGRCGKHKSTPILVRDGELDAARLHRLFLAEAGSLPEGIAGTVLEVLRACMRNNGDGSAAGLSPSSSLSPTLSTIDSQDRGG